MIKVRDGGVRREVLVVAYAQSAGGARFIVAEWPFGPRTFTAADDRGVSYQVSWRGEMASRELLLRPDPPRQVRWLDLTTAAGEPATGIDLGPQNPAPTADVTATPDAHSPGELLLDVIAARILTAVAPFAPGNPGQRAADDDLRAFVGDGPGHIVAARTRPVCCRRTAPSPVSSPGCAPGSVSPATASPCRPPGTCRNSGTAC